MKIVPKLEMVFFTGGNAELWNRSSNALIGAGKINAEPNEDGHNPFINLAIAQMVYKGDYDLSNPIQEGVVELED